MISWCLIFSALCVTLVIASLFVLFAAKAPVAGAIVALLSFIVGVSAIVFAIRYFYWMRYIRTTLATQVAVSVGSAGAGCFGIPLSGFILIMLIFGAVAGSISKRAETPEEAAKLCQSVMQIEIPEETNIEPVSGLDVTGIYTRILYRNDKTEGPANAWLLMERYPAAFTINKAQFWGMAKSYPGRYLGRNIREAEETELEWNIENENREIHQRTIYQVPVVVPQGLARELGVERPQLANENPTDENPDEPAPSKAIVETSETIEDSPDVETNETRFQNYYTVFDHGRFTFMLGLVYDPQQVELSESDIQKIFESIKTFED